MPVTKVPRKPSRLGPPPSDAADVHRLVADTVAALLAEGVGLGVMQ